MIKVMDGKIKILRLITRLNVGGPTQHVVWLTEKLEKKAVELIESIEEKGGFIESWESGYIRSIVERSARKWKESVDSGEKVVVGVNKHKMEEEQKIPVYKINPETEQIQRERDTAYKKARDAKKHEKAMKDLEETLIRFKEGDNDHSLILKMVEAARCDATSGEMMALMKEALGWINSAALAPC